jgi:hypothetical protein
VFWVRETALPSSDVRHTPTFHFQPYSTAMAQQMAKVGKVINPVLTWAWLTWRIIFRARNQFQRSVGSEWRIAYKCPEAMREVEPALRHAARTPQEPIHKLSDVFAKNRSAAQVRPKPHQEVATAYHAKDSCRL